MPNNNEQSISDLTPRPDNPILQKLHKERALYEEEVSMLKKELREARNELFATRQRLREELIKVHQEEFDVFYNQLMNQKTLELILWEEYNLQKHSLLKRLRSKQIDNCTYRKLLKPLSVKANQSSDAVHEFYSDGIKRIFGSDSHLFSIDSLQSIVNAMPSKFGKN